MRDKNLWQLAVQFIKFGFVGISNTLLSLLVYYLGLALGMHYVAANTAGFILGTVNAYFWNNRYVFKKNEGEVRSTGKSIVRVFISYGFTLALSTVLLALWVDGLHISDKIAPIINLLITIPLNFVLNKFWAFRGEKK